MGVLALLIVANLISNVVAPSWAYVPWNLAVAAGVVWIAHHVVTPAEMGFTRWASGARWGAALFALTTAVLLVATLIPVFDELYHDSRVDDSVVSWAYQTFVRIPLGTAVLEEVAFRAVLPALFAVRWGVLRGCLLASLWFGLWHVLPAWDLNEINPVAERWLGDGVAGTAAGIVFAVSGTMVAGLWWCWVRYRSGSILSTVLGHVATNSVAYTIAFVVAR